MKVTELFVLAELCSSKKEAKRMIASKALKINNIIIDDSDLEVIVVDDKLVIGTKLSDTEFLVHTSSISAE